MCARMFSSAASRDSGCLFSSAYIHAGDCWCHTSVWPIIFMSCCCANATILSARSNVKVPFTFCSASGFMSFSAVRLLNCAAISFARAGSSSVCGITAAPMSNRSPAAWRSVAFVSALSLARTAPHAAKVRAAAVHSSRDGSFIMEVPPQKLGRVDQHLAETLEVFQTLVAPLRGVGDLDRKTLGDGAMTVGVDLLDKRSPACL